MSRRTGLLLVVVIATVLYLPALRNGFAYDDVAIIQLDERVHSLRQLSTVVAAPYWHDAEMGLYRPLVTLSYAVDWTISGGSTTWFHLLNAFWNAAACGALFLLLTTFAPLGAALAGALLFALHPLHVEAVANVVGRAELMAATFTLSALCVWVKDTQIERPARGTVAALAGLFALALLSKESAIMLPALLVLVDAGRRALVPSNVREWLRRNAATLVTLAVIAVAYLIVRTVVLGNLGPARLAAALEVVGPVQQRLTALQIWPVILRLLVMPTVLLPDYAPRVIMPATGLTPSVVFGAVILLGLITGGIAAWLRGRGTLALTLLWLPVALLPVSNLVIPIGVLLAERALYLPSVALAFAVTLTLAHIPEQRATRLAFAATGLVAVLFAARTLVRIPEWQSTDTVFAALLRDRPDSYSAHWHTARMALRDGTPALAVERYGRALELWPHRRRLVLEAAAQSARVGNLPYARHVSTYMLGRWPDDLDAARLLASVALDMGDTAAARVTIVGALRAHPTDSLLLRMRAAVAPDTAS